MIRAQKQRLVLTDVANSAPKFLGPCRRTCVTKSWYFCINIPALRHREGIIAIAISSHQDGGHQRCKSHSALVSSTYGRPRPRACNLQASRNHDLTNRNLRLEVSRSHRILWLLEELQVPYELKTYKRGKDKMAPPELKEVHPLGKSPVITVEVPGRSQPLVLAESAAITEYLCKYMTLIKDQWPDRH